MPKAGGTPVTTNGVGAAVPVSVSYSIEDERKRLVDYDVQAKNSCTINHPKEGAMRGVIIKVFTEAGCFTLRRLPDGKVFTILPSWID